MKKPENSFTCKVRETLLRAEMIPGSVKPEAFRVGERLFCSLYSAGLYASEMKLEVEPLYSVPDSSIYTPERESHITDYMQDQINYYAKQLAALTVPQAWVACSERMPDDCQPVICSNLLTEMSGIPFIADYVEGFQLDNGIKYESGFYINRTPQTVLHWMPIPAPPKSEKP